MRHRRSRSSTANVGLVLGLLLLDGRVLIQALSGFYGLRSRLLSRHILHPSPSFPNVFRAAQPPSSSDNLNATLLSRRDASSSKSAQLIQEAEELRLQAKKLMAEALSMEADLKESQSKKEHEVKGSSSDLTQKLFESRPLTPEALAQAMKNERVSGDQAHILVEQLFTELLQRDPSLALGSGVSSSNPPSSSTSTENSTEAMLTFNRLECLFGAAELLDKQENEELKTRWPSGRVASSLRSHRNQLKRTAEFNNARASALQEQERKKKATETTTGASTSSTTTTVATNDTTLTYESGYQGFLVPAWLPPRLLALFDNATLAATKSPPRRSEDHPLSSKDVATIKQKVLTESRFVCLSSERIPSAAIFRGSLRPHLEAQASNKPPSADEAKTNRRQARKARDNLTREVYRDLSRAMHKQGLSKRVRLFFMTDPAEPVDVDEPTPVVIAIPSHIKPAASNRYGFVGRLVGKLSMVLAVVTLFEYSVASYALNPKFFKGIIHHHNAAILSICAPVFWGVLAIQVLHEVVHVLVARNRGIRIGWPLPIPSMELGSFGCITALKSFPANRKDLFDFSMGGPAAAALSSLACMVVGIHKTIHASSRALTNFPVLPVASFKSSFLVGALFTALAPKIMSLPLSQPIPIHPLFVIGFSGLITSALNLLPIFRLDGGRACDAAMGPRYGEFCSATTLMFLFSNVLSRGGTPLILSWFLFILMFQRSHEIPSQDEVTEISRLRFGGWVCAVVFSILSLMPFPGFKNPVGAGTGSI